MPFISQPFVPLPAGAAAVYNSSGLAYYRHPDWLGSSRFASTPTAPSAMYFDGAYAPFGEPYAQTGTTDLSFTGQNQDTVSALYDFPAREYGIQGRWPSPDPAGIAAVNPTDPQSWNRYAYVGSSPLIFIDPRGLCGEPDESLNIPDSPGVVNLGVVAHMPCEAGGGGGNHHRPALPPPNEGGGGAPGKGRAAPQPPAHPFLNCVANSGNEASLQGLLGLNNSKIAGAFLGNPISDLINAFTGDGSAAAGAGDAASAAAPTTLRQVPNVAVSYTSTTITASPSEFTVMTNEINAVLPFGKIASGAADALEGFTKLVQAPIDITASAFGAVVCAAGPPGG